MQCLGSCPQPPLSSSADRPQLLCNVRGATNIKSKLGFPLMQRESHFICTVLKGLTLLVQSAREKHFQQTRGNRIYLFFFVWMLHFKEKSIKGLQATSSLTLQHHLQKLQFSRRAHCDCCDLKTEIFTFSKVLIRTNQSTCLHSLINYCPKKKAVNQSFWLWNDYIFEKKTNKKSQQQKTKVLCNWDPFKTFSLIASFSEAANMSPSLYSWLGTGREPPYRLPITYIHT